MHRAFENISIGGPPAQFLQPQGRRQTNYYFLHQNSRPEAQGMLITIYFSWQDLTKSDRRETGRLLPPRTEPSSITRAQPVQESSESGSARRTNSDRRDTGHYLPLWTESSLGRYATGLKNRLTANSHQGNRPTDRDPSATYAVNQTHSQTNSSNQSMVPSYPGHDGSEFTRRGGHHPGNRQRIDGEDIPLRGGPLDPGMLYQVRKS